jgi:hypothetical protein
MVRRNVPGGAVCHLRIWYRHSLRGKKKRTTHPAGRAHQPSRVLVQVTHCTREPSVKPTKVAFHLSGWNTAVGAAGRVVGVC